MSMHISNSSKRWTMGYIKLLFACTTKWIDFSTSLHCKTIINLSAHEYARASNWQTSKWRKWTRWVQNPTLAYNMRKYLHCRNSITTFVVIFSFTEILVVDHITRRYRSTWRYKDQGPVSISDKTSYRKISQSLEAAIFVFIILRSFRNSTGTSAAMLQTCLSNFKAMRQFKLPISRLRDFTRSYDKMSYPILKWGPAGWNQSRFHSKFQVIYFFEPRFDGKT